jgi:WD40 repeat protein
VTTRNEPQQLAASATSTVDASGQPSATVDITTSNTGAALYRWTTNGSSVCSLAFSPDGKWLAIGQGNQNSGATSLPAVTSMRENAITILDMETGLVAEVDYGHTGSVLRLVWSPDGKLLASVSADGTIVVW